MRHASEKKWQLYLVNISFVVLFLAVVGLLQWLSQQYRGQFDFTQNNRNTLSQASRIAVERLKEPLAITAFASQERELRKEIERFVARYQKYKPDVELRFIDPNLAPEQARKAGVRFEGELVLQYGEAKESINPTQLNEEQFTNTLIRLGHRGERWVVFLGGHGERSPDRQANFDVSLFADQLRQRGFKTRTLTLAQHPQLPQNTSLLVITAPRVRLLAGEVKEIERFTKAGGNVLWLHDPGPLNGLEPIAEMLGIEFHPGVVVDPNSQRLTGDAATLAVHRYANHPVTRDFVLVTFFPHAAAIQLNTPKGWNGSVFIDTHAETWSETNSVAEFTKGKDIRGPLALGVALTYQHEKREQRIVVLGDGDFLSNRFLGNSGNLDLGMSLINWLSHDDAYVSIPVKVIRDRELRLSPTLLIVMGSGFVILLPLAFAASGLMIWLRRRKR